MSLTAGRPASTGGAFEQHQRFVPSAELETAAAMHPLVFSDLGRVSYEQGRDIQERLIRRRAAGEIGDICIFCEHPPVLSLGLRTDPGLSLEWCTRRGIEIVKADRGGGPTYHGPGQIVVYPVVSLSRLGIGVRTFVRAGLEVLSNVFVSRGIPASALLEPAGVWVPGKSPAGIYPGRKAAAVGLYIKRGITNHGFAVNIDNDLELYELFPACGLRGAGSTSLACELKGPVPPRTNILEELAAAWEACFAGKSWGRRCRAASKEIGFERTNNRMIG